MAFGASLRALRERQDFQRGENVRNTAVSIPVSENVTLNKSPVMAIEPAITIEEEETGEFDIDAVDLDAEIQYIEDNPKVLNFNEHNYSSHIQRLRNTAKPVPNNSDVTALGNSIIDLYQKGVITSLNREGIINGLRKYHDVNVNKDQALQIKKYISQENETVES